ncbi:MAG: ABC transporter substrate-binding protein [Gemmatimonadota bacterium]
MSISGRASGPAVPRRGKTRRRTIATVTGLAAAALLAAACGRSAGSAGGSAGNVSPTKGLVATTPAGKTAVTSVTWAVYRDVNSLDPIFAFDYPENTADSLMCESLLRQAPDGSLQPGLASVASPSPTSFVFTLRPGAKFWDGHPVTPADVVYSLQRNTDPKLGGFYGAVFNRVSSIKATGASQVTITLKQPDYWLQGELASMPGIIIEKSFAQAQGKNYGTPAGKIMCTGAYMFRSWTPGVGVTAVANPHYWQGSAHPLVQQITIKGAPDVSALTSALLTGGIQGTYAAGLATLDQLKNSSAVRVYQGPGWSTDAFIVSSLKGALGDLRVRRALSLALDRQGIIDSVYKGAALMPRWLSNPGTFGYGRSVFTASYSKAPVLNQNLAEAKKLVQQAGAAGKTLTIGTSSQLANISAVTGAYQAAAQAIGLKVVLKSVSAQNYINFFIDPKARAGIDGFLTINYGDYADPAGLLSTFDLPGGSQNYDSYSNPAITAALEQARSTADPNQRAALMVKAEQLTAQQLPWIPNVQPTSVLILNSKLTGAVSSFAYMFAPWANSLGGRG